MKTNVHILHHGHIYTGDPAHPWTDALAIVGGRIVAVGHRAKTWASLPDAHLESLEGATVLPGLADAHIHFLWFAQSLAQLDLHGLSRAETLTAVAQRVAITPPGHWIVGRGWDQNHWHPSTFPTAAELDRVAPHHPVALFAKSAHALWANSAAMQRAAISPQTAAPPHGRIGRAADGSPDGLFFEEAMQLILAAIPSPTVDEAAAMMEAAQTRMLTVGLTCVHDMDGGVAFAALQALHQRERLRLRVVKYVTRELLDDALALGLRSGFGDDQLRFGGLKLFADGALGARTAAMLAPYTGEPENIGLLTLSPSELRELVRRATAGGIAVAVHAIGDRANRLVVNVLAEATTVGAPLRHRIEHVQLITPEDRDRLARAGLVASMQPIHAVHDRPMAERYWGERTRHAYAWRSLQRAGAVLAFGSDAPVEAITPWPGLYAAVTRRAEDGSPSPEGWHPHERLSLADAVRAFTWGAAYAAGMENRLGKLWPGYHADLIVLDRDIFALAPQALLDVRVLRTMVGGVWVYRAEAHTSDGG